MYVRFNMRKFKQNKLWRDNMIDIVEKREGSRIHWRRLDDAAFDREIRIKLMEEAQEVVVSHDRKALVAELADLYQVIDSIKHLHTIPEDEIVAVQEKKRAERGGFEGRRFVEIAEHPHGGFGEAYCLADPEKYPEIIE